MNEYSKASSFLMLIFLAASLSAQYPIGKRDVTLNDPSRSRDIPCTFHYPGVSAGTDVAVASGQFPVIVFGHGFSMGVGAYENFANELVPLGYILCLPATETGLSPNHETFGLDLKFVNNEIISKASSDAGFFLYQKVTARSAIMGHSMGGGAAFLAAENNTNLTTLVTFAAAETSVSAIAAAANVTVPAIVFIGENDGVTPPADHQIPMYNALPAGCKGSITIKGGGHCYFANYNLACATGELFTSPQPSISREDQHLAMFNALKPYLAWMLKQESSQRQVFESTIGQTATYTSQFNCAATSIEMFSMNTNLYPNPVNDLLFIEFDPDNIASHVQVFSIEGKLLTEIQGNCNRFIAVDVSHLDSGIYIVSLVFEHKMNQYKIIKN